MHRKLPESRSVAETTVFQSGNSQAIRIPKEFQLHTRRVEIRREGRDLLLRPLAMTAAEAIADLAVLDDAECSALDVALRSDGSDLAALDE
jgi:antitoxin VapB